VKLSGVADQVESAWARVVSVGAGDSRGLQVVPDIGDEVLVGFEYGDVRRPLVIGGLWSGRHAHPKHPTSGAKDGAVWQTKGGHNLSMSDGSGAEGYARLALASGKTSLRLGGDASSLETERDLTVDSAGAVTIKGKTNVTVEAQNITVKAGARLVLEGSAGVEIKSNGQLKIDGAVVDVTARSNVSVQGGAIAQIKGAIVKIN
ncbi:MAG TPA: phage baseplate assembly protein V, partial [Acidimicrobiia bacterium]|nr:phage baseplate assembly protein V [Acidimicrobiia bacterium]